MRHPSPDAGSENDVVGRRIAATMVDSVFVFAVLYAGIWTVGGSPISRVVGLDPAVVVGFFLWFVFPVMTFMPLLFLHDFSPVWFGIAIGIWVAYATLLEAVFGRTVGKWLFGLVVTRRDHAPVTFRDALVRNLFRAVDGLFGYGVGFLTIAMSERRQRLGDMAAGTVVVSARDAWLSRALRQELPAD